MVFKCFFSRYKNTEESSPSNNVWVKALSLPEYSVVRVVEAENEELAMEYFLEHYEDDADVRNSVVHPHCIRL